MEPTTPYDEGPAGATPVGSAETPLGRGDVVNLMADLRQRLVESEETAKLTDVQNRLVMQRLENAGTWERPRAAVEEQVEEIANAVASVSAVEEETAAEALRNCVG